MSSKHRALTSVGLFAVLAACSVNACNKSDSADDNAGGTSSGGTGGGSSGASSAGAAGRTTGDAGEANNGGSSVGGSGTSGGDAGAAGAEDAGAPGTGGTGTAGSVGNGGTAGSGGGGVCTANTQTDKNNCGRCGKTCAGGDCDQGECTPVVVLDPKTDAIGLTTKSFLNGANVYEWETADDASLDPLDLRYRSLRASVTPATPASPGTIISDIPEAAPFIGSVTFDATSLYQCSSAGVTKVLLSATAATPTTLFKAPTVTGGFFCSNVAVSATAVYVTHKDITAGKETFYSINLAQANATTAPTLIPNIGARDTPVTNLSVIGNRLFWLEKDLAGTSQPRLMSSPIAGGAPTIVESDLGSGTTGPMIASDATYIYWTVNFGNIGTIRRAPLATLVPVVADVTQDVDTFKGLVVSGQYIYFMEGQSREVFRVKSDGSAEKEALGTAFIDDANGQHLGYSITGVDANFVYFLLDDGLIARLPNAP